MKQIISNAAHAASATLAGQGHACKRSHLAEIVAALLGYQTYAALLVEEADTSLEYHGEDAEFYIIDYNRGATRAESFGLPLAVTEACYQAFEREVQKPVFRHVDDFWDRRGRDEAESAIMDGVVTADSNASFADSPELESWQEDGKVWNSRESWSIEGEGVWIGDYDLEDDRAFNGDRMDVWAKLNYAKAGRAGLIYLDSEEGGAADDSWRGDD